MFERVSLEHEVDRLLDRDQGELAERETAAEKANAERQRKFKFWALLPHTYEVGGTTVPLTKGSVNPGFIEPNGKVKLNPELQRLLMAVVKDPKFSRIPVALADLSKDPDKPQFAGHLHDNLVSGQSVPKLAAMLAAFQARADVRSFAAKAGTVTDLLDSVCSAWIATQKPLSSSKVVSFLGIGLKDALLWRGGPIPANTQTWIQTRTAIKQGDKIKPGRWITVQKGAGGWKIPNVESMFTIDHWGAPPTKVEFAAEFKDKLDLMMGQSDNDAAAEVINRVGYVTIGSALMQYGLVHSARRGGVWLRASYGGPCLKEKELTLSTGIRKVCIKRFVTYHGFAPFGGSAVAVTASSLVNFLTLLAQGGLFTPARFSGLVSSSASKEMLDLMDKSRAGHRTKSPLTKNLDLTIPTDIFSKLGAVETFSDAVVVRRRFPEKTRPDGTRVPPKTVLYTAAALGGPEMVVRELGARLEECIRTNNGL